MSGAPAAATGLVARTRRVDGEVDLVAWAGDDGVVWAREGSGLAGRGEALRIGLDRHDAAEAQEALAAIAVDDDVGRSGTGPVALGALPFDPDAAAELVVPAQIVGRAADGTAWTTTVGPADVIDRVDAWDPPRPAPPPEHFEVRPAVPAGEWTDAVVAARDHIRAGDLTKVVLARELTVTADRDLSCRHVLEQLRASYPGCMLFSADGHVGASPELLVERAGDLVRAQPMAGTAARSGDPSADARLAASLLASEKDRWEHQITIDMVHDTLLPWCSYLDAEAEPSVVSMANVQHLATAVAGRLSSPEPSVLELVAALHPTPAVGGEPRSAALGLIAGLEPGHRGRYAGPVGWVDAGGNGQWAVGIRSAQVDGPVARVWAGVGVVADSDPDDELAETRAKLQALLTALVRP